MEIKRFIPKSIRPVIKLTYSFFLDILDFFRGKKKLTPPRTLIFVGDGDYEKTGQEFKNYFINLAGLQPNHQVLDIGCGIGRMAVPLTDYLTSDGGYWGFDIVKKGIVWCEKNITRQFNHFKFQHANIYNKFYNKNGVITGDQYRFPYESNFFDFVFLTSVFTHMLPDELENYLKEISRVIKPNGKVLITFFLLNNESKQLIELGQSQHNFKYEVSNISKTTNPNIPEDAVAYEENFMLSLLKKYSLQQNQPIHYGSWCGRKDYLSFQDIIVLKK